MDSILRILPYLDTAFSFMGVILAALGGVIAMMAFLMGRRALRHFRTRRFDALAFKIHKQWREIVRGDIPAEEWRRDSMQCEIVQSIVIQEISAATDKDRAGLQEFLRASGLVDRLHRKSTGRPRLGAPPGHAGARRDARAGSDPSTFRSAR